jgi:hypothetical protein
MKKLDNWKDALTYYISVNLNTPFKWGQHDCALWSADCVHVCTGIDFAKDARGTYSDALGAFKCLKKVYQVDNIKEVYSSKFEPIHVALALPGDIVYRDSNQDGFNCMIGICYGLHSFFIQADDDGLTKLPTLSLSGAFRI